MQRKYGGAQVNPLVKVTPNDDAYREALRRIETSDGPRLEARAREFAISIGVDPDLPPHERCMAMSHKLGATARTSRSGPSLRHMNAIVDAVESGTRFRREPLTDAEILAARRATGRMRTRAPGDDDEEVAA